MSKQPTEPAAPIRISTNTIWEGKFYTAGEPLPFERIADLPENLQPLVVTSEPEAEEPNEARANFQLNTVYELTDDNRLGRTLRRSVQRQVAQLEAENAQDDWIEEEVANAELPAEIVQDLQAQHEDAIAFAKAQAAADARRSDEAADAAAAAAEPPQLYVKRGVRHYAPAHKARLKPGEPVYLRQADGRFQYVGETTGDAEPELPDLPVQL